MKKVLVMLLIGIMTVMPSCGQKIKKENVTPLRPDCNVSTDYNGIKYFAKICYSETGVMTVEMSEPLKGMVFQIDDSGCQIGFDGMKLNYTTEQVKSFCPFIKLYFVLKTVCYTVPDSVRVDGEEYVLKYHTPEISCTAKSSRNSGTLNKIESEDIEFTFS